MNHIPKCDLFYFSSKILKNRFSFHYFLIVFHFDSCKNINCFLVYFNDDIVQKMIKFDWKRFIGLNDTICSINVIINEILIRSVIIIIIIINITSFIITTIIIITYTYNSSSSKITIWNLLFQTRFAFLFYLHLHKITSFENEG